MEAGGDVQAKQPVTSYDAAEKLTAAAAAARLDVRERKFSVRNDAERNAAGRNAQRKNSFISPSGIRTLLFLTSAVIFRREHVN